MPNMYDEDEKERERWYNNDNLTTQGKKWLIPPWCQDMERINT